VLAQYSIGLEIQRRPNHEYQNTVVIFNRTIPGNQTKNKIRTHLRLYSAGGGLSEPEPEFLNIYG
jgi:hypothetical protein